MNVQIGSLAILLICFGVCNPQARAQDALQLMMPSGAALAPPTTPQQAAAQAELLSTPANSFLRRAQSQRDEYKKTQQNLHQERYNASEQRIEDLRARQMRELEEYRNGLFCSGCNQTRSVILAKGEQFPHAGQHVIPATPAQIEEIKREQEKAMRAAEADRIAAKGRVKELEAKSKEITAETQKSAVAWRAAMLLQDEKRAEEWKRKEDALKLRNEDNQKEIARLQELVEVEKRLNRDKVKTDADTAQSLGQLYRQLDQARNSQTLLAKQAETDFNAYKKELFNFEKSVSDGRTQMSGLLKEVGGDYFYSSVPSSPFGESVSAKIPFTGLSAGLKEDGFTLTQSVGSLSVAKFRNQLSVSSDWLRGTMKVSVTMSADLPVLGGFGFGIGQTTGSGTISTEPIIKTGNVPNLLDLMNGK